MTSLSEMQFNEKVVPRLHFVAVPVKEGGRVPVKQMIVRTLLILLTLPISLPLIALGYLSWRPTVKFVRIPHGVENVPFVMHGVQFINGGRTIKFCNVTLLEFEEAPIGGDDQPYPDTVTVTAASDVPTADFRFYTVYGTLSINGTFAVSINKKELCEKSCSA